MAPALLVADEVTSALDPDNEAEIMRLLWERRRSVGISILYITHWIETVPGFADRVAVMRNGSIQEYGSANTVFTNPQSEYTRALLVSTCY
ncbi:hypothetical protein [Paenibacillus lycopersici]|uniref:hypothetical protein n=1 Tax=Paenibacillus lycopersici TaxID=2704462 RepID=UPI0021F09586|nr:hypothetical protein [Paenibacillus lycopersici]